MRRKRIMPQADILLAVRKIIKADGKYKCRGGKRMVFGFADCD
jgi:hypothetical protein